MGSKVSIIGAAGTLGSCSAFAIAREGLAEELVMIDLNENLVKCHAMDIGTAITGLRDMKVRVGRDEDLGGSDVVIVAAGAPYRYIDSRMELLNDSMPIIQEIGGKIAAYCPEAVVITATNPVDPLNYALSLNSTLSMKKLIGYSLNDSVRFRMLVARALGVRTTQVDGVVVGEHGEHQVLVFSSLRVDGDPVSVDEEFKEAIRREIPRMLHAFENLGTGRTSGWTSAVGMAAMVSAIIRDSNEVFPCSVILGGEYGTKGISVSVPVKLGQEGVREVVQLDLAPDEKERLDDAIVFLKGVARTVEEMVSSGIH